MNRKNRFFKIAFLVLALILTFSLCSCQSIAVFLLKNATQNAGQTTESSQNNGTTQNNETPKPGENGQNGGTTPQIDPDPADDPDVHLPDAEEIITQSDTEPTEHGSAGDQPFAVSEVVKKVQDSVVQIYTSTGSYGATSAGSGVIVSKNHGYVLTCNHVISGATKIVVELSDNTQYQATLVGADAATDLAVVKIEPDESRPLTQAVQGKSAGLVAGEYVVVIGNPLGTLGGSVTQGIISATERQIQITNDDGSTTLMTLLQTDAAINSGNSGGGLFNLNGELIGIVNAKYAKAGVEGLGFAIPIDTAYPIEMNLIEYGYVRGRVDDGLELGYRYYNYGFFSQLAEGIYVNSSKFTDQLQVDDRILSINGVEVNSLEKYDAELGKCKIGDVITIFYSRNNTITGTVEITLQEYKPDGK